MGLTLIGVGLGRTGTLSLKQAFEQLGLGRCYHMIEVLRRPDHAPLWSALAQGEDVSFDQLFEGYQGTVDWPGAYFWRELVDCYPKAKVVLTIRPAESWYQSISQTILPALQQPLPAGDPARIAQLRMTQGIVGKRTFQGRLGDKQHVLTTYEQHNAEVQRVVPKERLLVYDVAEGWTPLCEFLGVPVPKPAFPHVNRMEEFRRGVGHRVE